MEIELSITQFAELISRNFDLPYEENDELFIYKYSENTQLVIEKDRYNNAISKLCNRKTDDETIIYDSYSYEVLVREEAPLFPRFHRMLREGMHKSDSENDINYNLDKASDEYILYILLNISKYASDYALIFPAIRHVLERSEEESHKSTFEIFELFKSHSYKFLSLKIESENAKKLSEFKKFANAFLFEFCFNLEIALVPQQSFEELFRFGRVRGLRRSSSDEIEPPKRHYIPDLIYHYQMAIGTDNPLLQYLSFYHIAEHFYESVFEDDLIHNVREKITLPNFSSKRKTDVKRLIQIISDSIRIREDSVTFSEIEALKLTISQYVKINFVRNELKEYDSNIIDYYKTQTVDFSGGGLVNFDEDKNKIVSSIANRTYKTRNAVVHSKESEKSKYIPFEHDRLLIKEVPLLRFVAESIIIESSSQIS